MKMTGWLMFLILLRPFTLSAQVKQYFPKIDSADNFNGYSSYLSAFNEPVIFSDTTDVEIYRFLYLRTFHHPIVVRIEKKDNKYTVVWKLTNGRGGYAPGTLIHSKKKKITETEWQAFKLKLKKADFWLMPATKEDLIGNDGSDWLLEGKKGGSFHVVSRWLGGNASFATCCNYLLSLTDLKFSKEEKY